MPLGISIGFQLEDPELAEQLVVFADELAEELEEFLLCA